MSVDVKDFRKYVAAAAEKAAAENVPVHVPVEQVASPDASTGDEHLDKLVRAVQHLIDSLELVLPQVAAKAMMCPTVEMMRVEQLNYVYTKAKLDVLKEVITIPSKIVLESKLKS